MNENLRLSPNDMLQETMLKVNDTLKAIPTMSKNEAKEVYQETVNMILHEDLMCKFKGRAIKEICGEEMADKIAFSAAQGYNEVIQDGIELELTEEDEKILKDFTDL